MAVINLRRHPLHPAQVPPQQLSPRTRARMSMLAANVGLISYRNLRGEQIQCVQLANQGKNTTDANSSSHNGRSLGRSAAPAHDTHSPSSSSQVNGCTPSVDAMRIYLRYHASRGGQYAPMALLGSFGIQVPTNLRVVRWGTTIAHVVRS